MTKAEIQLVRSLADKRSRTEHGLLHILFDRQTTKYQQP